MPLPAQVIRFIVDAGSTIADYELNSPIAYLYPLAKSNGSSAMMSKCSTWFSLGAQIHGAPQLRRSSASNSPSEEFETSQDLSQNSDLSAFLSSLRFEKRNLLAELIASL
jgi:hypothetical protein